MAVDPTYHSDFWIAAATVSPVLLIAHGVALAEWAGRIGGTGAAKGLRTDTPEGKRTFTAMSTAAIYAFGSLTALIPLLQALESLSAEADKTSVSTNAVELGVSAILVTAQGFMLINAFVFAVYFDAFRRLFRWWRARRAMRRRAGPRSRRR